MAPLPSPKGVHSPARLPGEAPPQARLPAHKVPLDAPQPLTKLLAHLWPLLGTKQLPQGL